MRGQAPIWLNIVRDTAPPAEPSGRRTCSPGSTEAPGQPDTRAGGWPRPGRARRCGHELLAARPHTAQPAAAAVVLAAADRSHADRRRPPGAVGGPLSRPHRRGWPLTRSSSPADRGSSARSRSPPRPSRVRPCPRSDRGGRPRRRPGHRRRPRRRGPAVGRRAPYFLPHPREATAPASQLPRRQRGDRNADTGASGAGRGRHGGNAAEKARRRRRKADDTAKKAPKTDPEPRSAGQLGRCQGPRLRQG